MKKQKVSGKREENISQYGSQVERLYVTCCTEMREPLNQQLFKQLGQAYGNLGA